MNSNGNGRGTPASDVSSSYSMDFQTRQPPRQYDDKPVASAVPPSTLHNLNSLIISGKKAFNKVVTNSIDAWKPSMDDASDTVRMRTYLELQYNIVVFCENFREASTDTSFFGAGISPQ